MYQFFLFLNQNTEGDPLNVNWVHEIWRHLVNFLIRRLMTGKIGYFSENPWPG